MAQFDVHRSLVDPSNDNVPYLLDVQSDYLDIFDVRVVVPLFRVAVFARALHRLNPQFRIGGVQVVMATQLIAGTSIRNLGKVVARLDAQRSEIIGAIDMLITGV
jgi:toxin CcdB